MLYPSKECFRSPLSVCLPGLPGLARSPATFPAAAEQKRVADDPALPGLTDDRLSESDKVKKSPIVLFPGNE